MQGVVFTTLKSIDWLGQLLTQGIRYALHCDGTRRLHHGVWMLITLGCTSLEWVEKRVQHVNSFRPLVYLFCKQQETVPAVEMLVLALREVWYISTLRLQQYSVPGVLVYTMYCMYPL